MKYTIRQKRAYMRFVKGRRQLVHTHRQRYPKRKMFDEPQPKYYPQLRAALKQTYAGDSFYSRGTIEDAAATADINKQIRADRHIKLIVEDGKVTGAIRLRRPKEGKQVIDSLVILPSERNRGVGTKVVESLLKNKQVKEYVGSATEKSAPFWKKHGAEFAGETYYFIIRNKPK